LNFSGAVERLVSRGYAVAGSAAIDGMALTTRRAVMTLQCIDITLQQRRRLAVPDNRLKKNRWTIQWLTAMTEVDQAQWDRLAKPLQTPLLEWQWLHQLEASGSIAPQRGWHPRHLTLWENDTLVAAAPLYIKTHSQGEFVFDHWWVQLAENHGIAYYPKLVGMSPATPAVGYAFLIDDNLDRSHALPMMLSAIHEHCRANEIKASQFNFVLPDWVQPFTRDGYMAWHHQSYLWRNPGYPDFDAYLKSFKSSQRKNIRREVRRMDDAGIRIEARTGEQIDPGMAAVMYRYYLNTNAQFGPWAARYLNAAFFEGIFRHFKRQLLIIAAYHPSMGRLPLALSMLVVKNSHLIGRYWGCAKPFKDLHFNMCYYAPIRWAIANAVRTFDPGAGSHHKIYRGFKAVANTSVHHFYDARLNFLFKRLIGEVNQMEQDNIRSLNRKLPFAKQQG
jgi:hypothetical protein